MVKKLKAFAVEKEPNLMQDIINLEDKFAQCQVEKLLSRKQTKIVDYFKSTCKQVSQLYHISFVDFNKQT
jgi:hypothetical protein